MPGKTVNQDHLLADPQSALQDLGLDAMEVGIVFQQRLETRRVLAPERLPKRECLQERLALAVDRRLRLARIATGQLGVQEHHRLAHHFGDARPLARREIGLGQPLELPEDRIVVLWNVGERKRTQPCCTTIGIGERERRPPRVGFGSASA